MIPNKQCPSSNRNKISFEIDYKQQHKKDVPMHSQFTCTTQLCCTTPLNTMYKYKIYIEISLSNHSTILDYH
jgi:hypothetical protein